MEMEDDCINFLDVSIIIQQNSLQFKIYRKPTTTDIIIPADSNHPIDHKYSAIRYLLHRLQSYPLSDTHKHVEHDISSHILRENQYSSVVENIRSYLVAAPPIQSTKVWHNTQHHSKPRISTLHLRMLVKKSNVTNIFKQTNVKIAFKTKNTIERLLRHRKTSTQDDCFEKSGIYKLTCPDCNMTYVGQTGRSFSTRFREHARDFKYRTGNAKFAQHLIDQGLFWLHKFNHGNFACSKKGRHDGYLGKVSNI